MENPWLEWWEEATFQWEVLTTTVVLRQVAVLGVAMVLAFAVDLVLERYRDRLLGDEPGERKIRAVLWAAKYPVLVLLFGYLALSIYSATDWPVYSMRKLVTLFWFIAAYAVAAKAVALLMPPGEARRVIRRILLPLLAVVGILHFIGLLPVLWSWTSQPVITLAAEKVPLSSLGLAIVIVVGFWLVARWGRLFFLSSVLPRTHADAGLARSVAGFVQAIVIVIGLWIAFSSLGLEFSNLTLLLSALTVGIGFGLQDVVKNVMGGVILLSEGHIRPGEVFQIAGEAGVVERIGIRSTTIRTWDKTQIIVPNSYLISEKVSDLTGRQRVHITVGVSCDADPRLAERLLLEIAAAHPDVVDDPAPSVLFSNLGESSFDFDLYCFVEDRSEVVPTTSDLHYAIVETFRRHNLEMPYPQRDLHLRSMPLGQGTLLPAESAPPGRRTTPSPPEGTGR
jgi:small-conductance mechanosensitive channel